MCHLLMTFGWCWYDFGLFWIVSTKHIVANLTYLLQALAIVCLVKRSCRMSDWSCSYNTWIAAKCISICLWGDNFFLLQKTYLVGGGNPDISITVFVLITSQTQPTYWSGCKTTTSNSTLFVGRASQVLGNSNHHVISYMVHISLFK